VYSDLNLVAPHPQNQEKPTFFLDVVVAEHAPVLQLRARPGQTLLIRRNTLLVLDLGLDVFDGVRGRYIQRDCFWEGIGFSELNCLYDM